MLSGATGSGKTTQLPQYILDSGLLTPGAPTVLCTQPRRIAAVTVAQRVAAERGQAVGQEVGYIVRFQSQVGPDTRLVFCTPGILLRRLQDDPTLQGVGAVIIDEAHERDVATDFVMLVLKEVLLTGATQAKLVVMSATLQAEAFTGYFHDVAPDLADSRGTADDDRTVVVRGAPEGTGAAEVAELFNGLALAGADAVTPREMAAEAGEDAAYRRYMGLAPEVEWVAVFADQGGAHGALARDGAELAGVPVQIVVPEEVARRRTAIPTFRVEGRAHPVQAYFLEEAQEWAASTDVGKMQAIHAAIKVRPRPSLPWGPGRPRGGHARPHTTSRPPAYPMGTHPLRFTHPLE